MAGTASRALVRGLVALGVVVLALALWKLRVLLGLVFLAIILGSGMRPGIEALARRGVPRGIGVLLHYLVLGGLVSLALGFVVPQVLDEARTSLREQGGDASGGVADSIRHAVASGVNDWLHGTPSLHMLVARGIDLSLRGFAIVGGIAFVLACAAYWAIDRDRIRRGLVARASAERRERILSIWDQAEQRLGAYVRGQLLLISFVATTLSIAFRVIGLPYWLVLGIFAGVVEIIPMVGPLAAGVVTVGVGLTVSVHAAALAAAAVYGLRLLQDYVIVPRVIGHAVELPPLLTLVVVAIAGVTLGPAMVPFATPFVAVLAVVFARGRPS